MRAVIPVKRHPHITKIPVCFGILVRVLGVAIWRGIDREIIEMADAL